MGKDIVFQFGHSAKRQGLASEFQHKPYSRFSELAIQSKKTKKASRIND